MPKLKKMETIVKRSEQIDKEIQKLKGQNFHSNYMQTIFNVVLLIILIVEVFLNIYICMLLHLINYVTLIYVYWD